MAGVLFCWLMVGCGSGGNPGSVTPTAASSTLPRFEVVSEQQAQAMFDEVEALSDCSEIRDRLDRLRVSRPAFRSPEGFSSWPEWTVQLLEKRNLETLCVFVGKPDSCISLHALVAEVPVGLFRSGSFEDPEANHPEQYRELQRIVSVMAKVTNSRVESVADEFLRDLDQAPQRAHDGGTIVTVSSIALNEVLWHACELQSGLPGIIFNAW